MIFRYGPGSKRKWYYGIIEKLPIWVSLLYHHFKGESIVCNVVIDGSLHMRNGTIGETTFRGGGVSIRSELPVVTEYTLKISD